MSYEAAAPDPTAPIEPTELPQFPGGLAPDPDPSPVPPEMPFQPVSDPDDLPLEVR